MKHLACIAMCWFTVLNAQYNPTMRINFGASSSVVRLQAGYFNSPYTANEEGSGIEQTTLFSNTRLGFEGLLMLNNRGNFTESVYRTAPRFLLAKVNFDGFKNLMLTSASFAQGFNCQTTFPGFGQIKGYWSIGTAMKNRTMSDAKPFDAESDFGARAGLNIYNKNSAMQAEVIGFKNKAIVNVLVYRKLGEHILIHGGVECNQALVGFSALAGSCRISINSRLYKERLQHGFSLTLNI
jgi:hypothetical protein